MTLGKSGKYIEWISYNDLLLAMKRIKKAVDKSSSKSLITFLKITPVKSVFPIKSSFRSRVSS